MGSTRLPQKTLMKFSGKSLLYWVINSAKKNNFIDEIIVVTTTLAEDDAIEDACAALQVVCKRGSPTDVLSRYITIAKECNKTDQIVRITADNPLNNVNATAYLYAKHLQNNADYTCVEGLSHTVYEFMKAKALVQLASNDSLQQQDKEHVTKYMRENPNLFKVQNISAKELAINPKLDKLLTIDTENDYLRMMEISNHFDLNENIDFIQLYKFLQS